VVKGTHTEPFGLDYIKNGEGLGKGDAGGVSVFEMVTSLPTGLVSFLFTDVEGSTRLWEQDRDAMAASLALHDQIMTSVIDAHAGHVFSTAGDAFAVAFPSIEAAVGTAIEIQRDLQAAEWPGPAVKVRMGIHTGEAQERNGDYFGPVLNRAARIMSAGHGGQILLSSVTASGTTETLHDLGTHHLKDLDEPEHVFEIRLPDLPTVDRPIRTLDVRRHNLPDYLTSFVGRTRQLDELTTLIADHRLVSLTGVGGTGKTRLAVEAARRAMSNEPDGAWLIELAPVTNPHFIMSTIADTWGLRAGEGASIEDVVTRYLWSRDLLLVIDNCEHLLDSAAAAIKFLLDACPDLRVIATSRESLGIPGEAMLRVPSLGLADASHALEDSEAVRLFLDRAAAVRPDRPPSAGEMTDIGRICTRIDGIPLGIELAAARLRSMSTTELANRLDESFRILSGSAKTALPRQRTLAATIDWSYDLLKPSEQAVFRRLSVFTGGFDLDAAEAVCAGEGVEDWEVLDHLDSLVDKSLVIPAPDDLGHTRYRMLEPVRQYGQERLSDTAEPIQFRKAHARYFAELIGSVAPGLRTSEFNTAIKRLDHDYDNIRSALTTLLETGDLDGYLGIAFDLFSYWMHKGLSIEGIELALEGLHAADDSTDSDHIIKVWWTTAILAAELTMPEGTEYAQRGLDLARRLGDPNAIGRMELALGAAIRHATTDPSFLEHLMESRRLLEAHPAPHWWDPKWEHGLIQLLLSAYLPMEDERVGEHIQAALDVFEQVGDLALLGATLNDSAGYYYVTGDRERGLENSRRACEIYADIDSPNWYGHARQLRGLLLKLEDDPHEASSHFAEAAGLLDQVGDISCWANSTRGLAGCETALGMTSSAARRLLEILERMPSLPMQEVTKPRTLDAIAETLVAAGKLEEGGLLLGASIAAPVVPGSVVRPAELEQIRARAVEKLGELEADRLFAEGAALELDEALERGRRLLADL
jgi:predicted ATPase/class 3 adenylate cyclase